MAKFLVKRHVVLSKVVEARTREEAIEEFGDLDADQRVTKQTAKRVRVPKVKKT